MKKAFLLLLLTPACISKKNLAERCQKDFPCLQVRDSLNISVTYDTLWKIGFYMKRGSEIYPFFGIYKNSTKKALTRKHKAYIFVT